MITSLWETTAAIGADPGPLAALAARIVGIGLLIQSLELAANGREFPSRRLLGWRGSGTPARSALLRFVRWLQQPPAVLLILLGRAGAAGTLAFGPANPVVAFGLITALLVAQLYYNRRFYDVASNADVMFLIVLAGLWFSSVPGASDRVRAAGLLFIAVHVALAYVSTGWNKLTSPHWRDGNRLRQLFCQGGRGFAPVSGLFAPGRPWAAGITWSVIILELVIPLGVVLPTPVFAALLVAGLCFHASIAVTMGLHDFFWAFAAGYPALWFAHRLIGA